MPLCSPVSAVRVLALAAGMTIAPGAPAQTVYFADISVPTSEDGSIRRVNADGTGLGTVLTTGGGLLSIDVDQVAGKIYFSIGTASAIRRCNLDGSGAEDFTTDPMVQYPAVVRVNRPQGTLLWGDQSAGQITGMLLTSPPPFALLTTPFHRGLAIDTGAQLMYWSTDVTNTTGNIMRATTGGPGSTTVVSGAGKPAAIALDAAGGKVYWTDYVTKTVRRANLDGSGVQTLYTDPFGRSPRGIALDLVAGRVYWGQDVGDETPAGEIWRAPLDGSALEYVQTGLGLVQDLVVIPAAGAVCYPNCDGSTSQPVLNVADFTCFLQKFAAGDAYANCDASTSAPTLNVADFTCFLQKFAAGCH